MEVGKKHRKDGRRLLKEDLSLQAKSSQAASEKRPTPRHSLTSSRAKTFQSPSERKYTTAIELKRKCTSKGRHQTPLQSFSQGLHSNFTQMLFTWLNSSLQSMYLIRLTKWVSHSLVYSKVWRLTWLTLCCCLRTAWTSVFVRHFLQDEQGSFLDENNNICSQR